MATNATRSLDDVTVLLIGHADSGHRQRAVNYYDRLGVRCLALASEPGTADADLAGRLGEALQGVDTPFVVLAQDADFILAPALEHAADALRQRADCVAAQGFALGYRAGNSHVAYYKQGSATAPTGKLDASAQLEQYALGERQAWRAVMRCSALQAALDGLPAGLSFIGWQVLVAYRLLAQGPFVALMQTDVVCEYPEQAVSTATGDVLRAQALRLLRACDEQSLQVCGSDAGAALLHRFVEGTCGQAPAPLLFTSRWTSVIDDPVRDFEPRQYVELPYYNADLFAQLSALELMLHAWPTGTSHRYALEGTWVRQRDLLVEHPNDNQDSLKERFWRAQALNLFNVEVNRLLLSTLTAEDERECARELEHWLSRLLQFAGAEQATALEGSESGQLLEAIAQATPSAVERERLLAQLPAHAQPQVAFVVLDLNDDNAALQATFDSLVASGLRNFKLVVLKAGKSPAITSPSDTLHFVEVTQGNWVSYLNHALRQLPSEWVMLLQAGDMLTPGGALRLQLELAEGPDCVAICANEVQRDSEGRLKGVLRPGSDLDALRSRPDRMAGHWLIRRDAVIAAGGYSETHRQAVEFDLLLRLVEQRGPGGLAHMDELLVVGHAPAAEMITDAVATLERHLTVLGYQGRVSAQKEGHLLIDFRHSASPMVSIVLTAGSDAQQLRACLVSIVQRTRYSRYEIVLACSQDNQQVVAEAVPGLGSRVRFAIGQSGSTDMDLLNLAVGQAQGEYLVLFSPRCKVDTPGWIEALLNQGLRPEVGVVGGCLLDAHGRLLHAGYALSAMGQASEPWQGLAAQEREDATWPLVVRGAAAVSADCLMIRKALFGQLAGLAPDEGGAIGLGQRAAANGLMVVWTPEAQLLADA